MKKPIKYLQVVLIIFFIPSLFILTGSKQRQKNTIPYTILEQGNTISYRENDPTVLVFKDVHTFESFYRKIHRTVVPAPSPPDIDFDQCIVIFISYGQQKSAGYDIELRNVCSRASTVVVNTLFISPPEGSFQAQVITHPYLLLSIRKNNFKRVELTDEIGEVLDYKNI